MKFSEPEKSVRFNGTAHINRIFLNKCPLECLLLLHRGPGQADRKLKIAKNDLRLPNHTIFTLA